MNPWKNRDPGKTFELDKKLLKPFQNRSDVIGFTMKQIINLANHVEENRLGGGGEEVGRIGRPEPVEDPETQNVLLNFSSWQLSPAFINIRSIKSKAVEERWEITAQI